MSAGLIHNPLDLMRVLCYNSFGDDNMANKFKQGDTAFIVANKRFIKEVRVVNCIGGQYTLRFVEGNGGIRLREDRLYSTKTEAENSIK